MTDRPIYILNGPNLNLLGHREPEIYGTTTLVDIEATCRAHGSALSLAVECRQSNHEGVLIDWIHEARTQAAGVILNAGGLSHSSISLMDAAAALKIPLIEVHLSNIHAREAFRHSSYISRIAAGVIVGLGAFGYQLALDALANILAATAEV